MKIIFVLIMSTTVFASMLEGECLAKPESKRYLSNNLSEPYPKTISFHCVYECLSDTGVELIKGTSHIKSFSMQDDARKIVCQGVQVKKVPWGFEYDGVRPFFSHQTLIKEIKSWANDNVSINAKSSAKLRAQLRENMLIVGKSYIQAGLHSKPFQRAGEILLQMVSDESLLQEYILLLRERLLAGELKNELSNESLILNFLNVNARWMLSI